jgi:hypothetical protein
MPVYKLLDELTYTELLGWFAFFDERPPSAPDDIRTFYILQALGVKEKPDKLFESLKPRKKSVKVDPNFLAILQGATGGDKLNLNENNSI